jgi:hypothetical protein
MKYILFFTLLFTFNLPVQALSDPISAPKPESIVLSDNDHLMTLLLPGSAQFKMNDPHGGILYAGFSSIGLLGAAFSILKPQPDYSLAARWLLVYPMGGAVSYLSAYYQKQEFEKERLAPASR